MTQLVHLVNEKDHASGDEFATIELVEYGDYECPFCGRAYEVVKEIKRTLGRDIRFVFRNFPLRRIHPHAFSAALATEAAALQQKFWEMHNIIFSNQENLGIDKLLRMADRIGIDAGRLYMDMQEKSIIEKVEKDFEGGIRSGVNRTPSFFINGGKFIGDWESGQLLQALKSMRASMPIY